MIKRTGVGARMSDVIIYQNTLYVVEVPENLSADMKGQAKETLALLEKTLTTHGTHKSNLLMVTIYLKDLADLADFNQIWDAWVSPAHTPVRCCVQAQLANPGYLLELQVTAAVL